eukprot:m.112364 g.112364  ORF g.112364 m.112364 type:complete len:865 (+) comp16177_c0_seq1:505-3099(+)
MVVTQPAGVGATCPALTDEEECNTEPCPQDCELSEWTRHGDCSATCGSGFRLMVRRVLQHPAFGGKVCGQTFKQELCNNYACPNDCITSAWTDDGECSRRCGSGVKTQRREIIIPAGPGHTCKKPLVREVACNEEPCEQDCQVSPWIKGPCSASCGYATRIMTRNVVYPPLEGGKPCPLLSEPGVRCDLPPCEPEDTDEPVDCVVSEWNDRNPCSVTCGVGTYERIREIVVPPRNGGAPCPSLVKVQSCAMGECLPDQDCVVGDWEFGKCSVECGGGVMHACRRVLHAQFGSGKDCPALTQTLPCNTKPCDSSAVDCQVDVWSEWTSCWSARCGTPLTKTRTREVILEASGGGEQCPLLSEIRKCTQPPEECTTSRDCKMSEWSKWNRCSVGCGGGLQYRSRAIITPPMGAGASCPKNLRSRTCNSHPCNVTAPLRPVENLEAIIKTVEGINKTVSEVVMTWSEPSGDDIDFYSIYPADESGRIIGERIVDVPSETHFAAIPVEMIKTGAKKLVVISGNDYKLGSLPAETTIPRGLLPTDGGSDGGGGISSGVLGIVGALAAVALVVMAVVVRRRRQNQDGADPDKLGGLADMHGMDDYEFDGSLEHPTSLSTSWAGGAPIPPTLRSRRSDTMASAQSRRLTPVGESETDDVLSELASPTTQQPPQTLRKRPTTPPRRNRPRLESALRNISSAGLTGKATLFTSAFKAKSRGLAPAPQEKNRVSRLYSGNIIKTLRRGKDEDPPLTGAVAGQLTKNPVYKDATAYLLGEATEEDLKAGEHGPRFMGEDPETGDAVFVHVDKESKKKLVTFGEIDDDFDAAATIRRGRIPMLQLDDLDDIGESSTEDTRIALLLRSLASDGLELE